MAIRATVKASQVKPQSQVKRLQADIRSHVKLCAACTRANRDTRRWCDERWALEKNLKRLENAAGAAMVRAAADQPTLPFGQAG